MRLSTKKLIAKLEKDIEHYKACYEIRTTEVAKLCKKIDVLKAKEKKVEDNKFLVKLEEAKAKFPIGLQFMYLDKPMVVTDVSEGTTTKQNTFVDGFDNTLIRCRDTEEPNGLIEITCDFIGNTGNIENRTFAPKQIEAEKSANIASRIGNMSASEAQARGLV